MGDVPRGEKHLCGSREDEEIHVLEAQLPSRLEYRRLFLTWRVSRCKDPAQLHNFARSYCQYIRMRTLNRLTRRRIISSGDEILLVKVKRSAYDSVQSPATPIKTTHNRKGKTKYLKQARMVKQSSMYSEVTKMKDNAGPGRLPTVLP